MISIIVPVYNVEQYLNKCIESLVTQTYENLEIILVDDGSTDSSGMICDKWKERCNKIVVIHQKNSGVSNARNAGLKVANGKYIGFVDADDYVDSNMYEILYNSMDETTDIAVCGYNNVSDQNNIPVLSSKKCIVDSEIAVCQCIKDNGWGLYIWNKLFRKEVIYQSDGGILLFPEDLFIGEDALWLIMACYRSKFITYVPKACYYYVARINSAVSQSKGIKKLESCISRYYASLRCYNFLKDKENKYSYLMFRRCVFSARDVACELYLTENKYEYYEWIIKFRDCLNDYRKMLEKLKDRMFLIKNYILYFCMKLHLSKKVIIFILNRKGIS